LLRYGSETQEKTDQPRAEMTDIPQSSRDRILWILANHGGKMDRSSLRRFALMKYAFLDPLLAELAREGIL